MNITTENTIKVVIVLEGDECRQFLVDPAPVQAQVRSALSAHAEERSANRIKAQRAARAPKAQASVTRTPPAKTPCPKCGKSLDPRGLPKHLRTCRGAAA